MRWGMIRKMRTLSHDGTVAAFMVGSRWNSLCPDHELPITGTGGNAEP